MSLRARAGLSPAASGSSPDPKKSKMDSADYQLDTLEALQGLMAKIPVDQRSSRQAGVASALAKNGLPPIGNMTKEFVDQEIYVRTENAPPKWSMPEKLACLRALREEQDPAMVQEPAEPKAPKTKPEMIAAVVQKKLMTEEEISVLKLTVGDLRLLMKSQTDPDAKLIIDKTVKQKLEGKSSSSSSR